MSARDINVGILTADRTPRDSYLEETLENLKRGGIMESTRVHDVGVFDTGPKSGADRALAIVRSAGIDAVSVYGFQKIATANQNVAALLQTMADPAVPWVMMIEDDVDVCADFFDSVGAWLDEHADDRYRIFPLGANYGNVVAEMKKNRTAWEYPIGDFYGTQAIVLRWRDAISLASWLRWHNLDRTEDGSAYDLLMGDWMRARYPQSTHHLTPAPSFVQHIGRQSVIRPRNETHVFPSWPGRSWSYLERKKVDRKAGRKKGAVA